MLAFYRKAHFDKSKAGKKHLTSVRKTQGGLSTSELTDDQKALIARGKLLARGYSFLVFRVDGISLQCNTFVSWFLWRLLGHGIDKELVRRLHGFKPPRFWEARS